MELIIVLEQQQMEEIFSIKHITYMFYFLIQKMIHFHSLNFPIDI